MCPPPAKRPALPVAGITGAVGTGKSAVAALFKRWGGVVISGDAVGKDVVNHSKNLQRQLAHAFGDDILGRHGVKRALLARRAFASAESTDRLNRIVHPYLLKELNARIRKARRSANHRAVVIDAALLAEWGPGKVYWDCLIGVWAPMALRRQRLQRPQALRRHPQAFMVLPLDRLRPRFEGLEGHHQRPADGRLRLRDLDRARGCPDVPG